MNSDHNYIIIICTHVINYNTMLTPDPASIGVYLQQACGFALHFQEMDLINISLGEGCKQERSPVQTCFQKTVKITHLQSSLNVHHCRSLL